jgi:hypothetical protein
MEMIVGVNEAFFGRSMGIRVDEHFAAARPPRKQ